MQRPRSQLPYSVMNCLGTQERVGKTLFAPHCNDLPSVRLVVALADITESSKAWILSSLLDEPCRTLGPTRQSQKECSPTQHLWTGAGMQAQASRKLLHQRFVWMHLWIAHEPATERSQDSSRPQSPAVANFFEDFLVRHCARMRNGPAVLPSSLFLGWLAFGAICSDKSSWHQALRIVKFCEGFRVPAASSFCVLLAQLPSDLTKCP